MTYADTILADNPVCYLRLGDSGGGYATIVRESFVDNDDTYVSGAVDTVHDVDAPSGLTSGDVVVVFIQTNGSSLTTPIPTGFVQMWAAEGQSNPKSYAFVGAYDDVGAGPWTFYTTAAIYIGWIAARYSGVDNTTPQDVTAVGTDGAAATSWSLDGITTVTDGAMVVGGVGSNSSSAARMTWDSAQVVAEFDETFLGGAIKNTSAADGTQATAGATGSITGTINSTLAWAGGLGALRPAAATTTATDASGNGYDFAFVGTPTPGAASLLLEDPGNDAMTFEETTPSYIQNTTDAFMPTGAGPWTVEYWIKTSSLYIVAPAVGWGGASTDQGFQLGATSSGLLYSSINGETGSNFPGTNVTDGAAHHVAFTWDGEFVRVYLDGEFVGTINLAGVPNVPASHTVEVGYWDGLGAGTDGDLDEVAFYTYALTQNQIHKHYAVGQLQTPDVATAAQLLGGL